MSDIAPCGAKSSTPSLNLTAGHPFHICSIRIASGRTHLGKHLCRECEIPFEVKRADPEATLLSLDNIDELTEELPTLEQEHFTTSAIDEAVALADGIRAVRDAERVGDGGDTETEDRTPPRKSAVPVHDFLVPSDLIDDIIDRLGGMTWPDDGMFVTIVAAAYNRGCRDGAKRAGHDVLVRQAIRETANGVDEVEQRTRKTFATVFKYIDYHTRTFDAHRDKLIELDERLSRMEMLDVPER